MTTTPQDSETPETDVMFTRYVKYGNTSQLRLRVGIIERERNQLRSQVLQLEKENGELKRANTNTGDQQYHE
jgi:hypothetical protein